MHFAGGVRRDFPVAVLSSFVGEILQQPTTKTRLAEVTPTDVSLLQLQHEVHSFCLDSRGNDE